MGISKRLPLLLLLAAGACASTPAAPAKDIYVMRHLDTPAGERDPDLLPAGRETAERLAERLGAADLRALYVTPYKRTRQTAAPLAARLGLQPLVYDPADNAGLVARVRSGPLPALIVGHSNTVPEIVAALGGEKPAPLAHGDFGSVWRVGGDGATTRMDMSAAR